jgi:hypothetical protein
MRVAQVQQTITAASISLLVAASYRDEEKQNQWYFENMESVEKVFQLMKT